MDFDAVILAGGASSRMGGRDKSMERVGERTLLEIALEAASGAQQRIVVGPERHIEYEVVQVVEPRPFGGPVSAIAEGLGRVRSEAVVVLASDMPWITADFISSLLDALSTDAVCAVDPSGRLQFFPSAFRRRALVEALATLEVFGAPLRALFDRLEVATIPGGGESIDCDTPEELEAARRAAGDGSR